MHRVGRFALLVIVAFAVVAGPVEARLRCTLHNTGFPTLSELTGSNVGCTTVRGVAVAIQEGWAMSQSFPRRVEAVDRTWRCTYRERRGETNPYYKATCISGRRTVGAVLGS
jgi:hypothetical protein